MILFTEPRSWGIINVPLVVEEINSRPPGTHRDYRRDLKRFLIEIHIAKAFNREGEFTYAVRINSNTCVNALGEDEYEVSPSSRDDEFMNRCRYTSFEQAKEALTKFVESI